MIPRRFCAQGTFCSARRLQAAKTRSGAVLTRVSPFRQSSESLAQAGSAQAMTKSLASLSERALEDLRDVFARLPDDAADYRSLCAVHT